MTVVSIIALSRFLYFFCKARLYHSGRACQLLKVRWQPLRAGSHRCWPVTRKVGCRRMRDESKSREQLGRSRNHTHTGVYKGILQQEPPVTGGRWSANRPTALHRVSVRTRHVNVMTKLSLISVMARIPHHSLHDTQFSPSYVNSGHGWRDSMTEGAGRGPLLAERGHQSCGSREGDLEHRTG